MPNPSVRFFETQKETAILRTKYESDFKEHLDNCEKLIKLITNTSGNMNNGKSSYVFLKSKANANANAIFATVNKQLTKANKSLIFMQIYTDRYNAIDMQLLEQHKENFKMINKQVENLAKQSASNAPASTKVNTQLRSKL